MSDTEEALRRKIEATIKTWRETTPEGRAFCPSAYNIFVLIEDGVKRLAGGLTVANLTLAHLKLSRIYDFSRDARPVKVIPPTPVPVETPEQRLLREAAEKQAAFDADQKRERELFTEWEKPVGNENEFQRLQRVAALKEEYMRKKFPRAEPSKTPHPSTVRNTKADLKFRR